MSTKKTAPPLLMQPLTSSEKGKVLAKLQAAKPSLTIRELAQLTGISPSYVSKLLKRERGAGSSDNA